MNSIQHSCTCAGGAESVIDIDDGYAGGAAVDHGEQGGYSAERRPVADAGRDCDDGRGDESGNDARERTFHSGNGNDGVRFPDFLNAVQPTVDARTADKRQVGALMTQMEGGKADE